MSDLQSQVLALAMTEDKAAVADLLLSWPDQDEEWKVYANAASLAADLDASRRAELQVAIEAYESNHHESEMSGGMNETSVENSTDPAQDFYFSQEERQEWEIAETIYSLRDEPAAKLESYIASLNIETLSSGLQQHIHQHITGLLWLSEGGAVCDEHIESSLYRDWIAKFGPEQILANPNFGLDLLQEFCTNERALIMLQGKDYFQYKLDEGEADTSFTEYTEKYLQDFAFDVANTESELCEFEQNQQRTFPDELREFYLSLGRFYCNPDCTFQIPTVNEWRSLMEGDCGEPLAGLGIVDLMAYLTASEAEYIQADDQLLSQARINTLNRKYTSAGYFYWDDYTILIVYYDTQGKFGVALLNPASSSVLDDFLYPMEQASLAQHNLAQLWAAILSLLKIPYVVDEKDFIRDFVLKTRAIGPKSGAL